MDFPPSDFANLDYFTLFALPRQFAIDLAALEVNYRKLQEFVHPDKNTHLSDAGRRLSLQWSTQVNTAWQTLRDPLARARYLLGLVGTQDDIDNNNTALTPDFLMQQMERREALEIAQVKGDIAELEGLHRQVQAEVKAAYEALRCAFDETQDYVAAAEQVRQGLFQRKMLDEIDAALLAAEG